MIGGTDVIIPTSGGTSALDVCLRVIRRHWPDAIFEDALTEAPPVRYELLPIGGLKEVLAYKDIAAAESWDEKGADPSLANTMIHLLLEDRNVTVVVDDMADPAVARLLASLRSALHVDILNIHANRRIAA